MVETGVADLAHHAAVQGAPRPTGRLPALGGSRQLRVSYSTRQSYWL